MVRDASEAGRVQRALLCSAIQAACGVLAVASNMAESCKRRRLYAAGRILLCELTPACQKCGKEFNALWRRGHACGHCGHEFCSSCLEGQALMPRRARTNSGGPLAEIRGALRGQQQSTGYDVESVCAYCLGMLQGECIGLQGCSFGTSRR